MRTTRTYGTIRIQAFRKPSSKTGTSDILQPLLAGQKSAKVAAAEQQASAAWSARHAWCAAFSQVGRLRPTVYVLRCLTLGCRVNDLAGVVLSSFRTSSHLRLSGTAGLIRQGTSPVRGRTRHRGHAEGLRLGQPGLGWSKRSVRQEDVRRHACLDVDVGSYSLVQCQEFRRTTSVRAGRPPGPPWQVSPYDPPDRVRYSLRCTILGSMLPAPPHSGV